MSLFTGLIQDVGKIESIELGAGGARLRVATALAGEVEPGDSIAVNGVCLTATAVDRGGFETETMNQTLKVTTLGGLDNDSRVNLELAMRASDRLGGHIVQGHVDDVGEVIGILDSGFSRRLRVDIGPELGRYAVEKGSIALNGVSLTISALSRESVEVSLIPETLVRTNLGEALPESKVNVECDVIAKHVERLVAPLARKEQA
ncbi:MAG TPA: riboflavin synthase [Solirubrobacterales bacterium]